MTPARQTAIGLSLAAAIIGGWVGLHVWGVFFQPLAAPGVLWAPLLIAAQSWLGAGMFIVAHDAMHGSLAPGRSGINRAVGALAVAIYAGFRFGDLNAAHHAHHRSPGSAEDPDFHPDRPRAFGAWFVRFFRRYFGLREFALVTAVLLAYLLLGAHPLNLALFWGLPAILSALQLFVFGTWLPHRHASAFADRHNARSSEYGWLVSLLTCFHFGYHLEHHHSPTTPWWRLPAYRRARMDGAGATA